MSSSILAVNDVSGAPAPAGHYAAALIHGDTVYLSGQLARVPGRDPAHAPAGVSAQVTQCLTNAEAVLKAAGSSRDRVLRATIYLSSIDGWADANAAFADFFGTHKPARSIIPCGSFKAGFLVEIDLVAARD